jgi:hypothetical protein
MTKTSPRTSECPLRLFPKAGWLEKVLERYHQVRQGILEFTACSTWPKIRDAFDARFTNAMYLPDIRKADLVIWAVPKTNLAGQKTAAANPVFSPLKTAMNTYSDMPTQEIEHHPMAVPAA